MIGNYAYFKGKMIGNLIYVLILRAEWLETTDLRAYFKGKNDENHSFRSDLLFRLQKILFREKVTRLAKKKVPLYWTLVQSAPACHVEYCSDRSKNWTGAQYPRPLWHLCGGRSHDEIFLPHGCEMSKISDPNRKMLRKPKNTKFQKSF